MYWDHGRGFYKKIEFINERNEAAKRLGQLWEKYGQLECAAENFASIQLPSVDDPTLEHAGDLYLQTGNSEQAFQAYRRAINKSNRRLNDIPVIDSMFPSLSRSWDIQIIKDTGEKRDTILAKIKKNGLERFANHLPLNWANTHDSSLEYF
jgi:tetratricopeptide (TPR) repeat protein